MEESIDEEEGGMTIICGVRDASPHLASLVAFVAVVLCVWAIVKLWRSRDVDDALSVLRLLGRAAALSVLIGALSFLMYLIDDLNVVAAMAGMVNTADAAHALSVALMPVVITAGVAALLLTVRAVLEYWYDAPPASAG